MSQNQKTSNKKRSLFQSLAILVVALLLLVGQHLGILPGEDSAVSLPTTAPTVTPATTLENGSFFSEEVLTAPKLASKSAASTKKAAAPIIEPQAIADYLFEHEELPDNFITKSEAQKLGWDSSKNYVSDVAPGMSIGGDMFGNREGLLPKAKDRQYYEADCYYTSGKRNAHRVVYSNDGLVFYTNDHYETFTQLFPSKDIAPIIEPQAIADYIFEHGKLPPNFITKSEAQKLGWNSSKNDVSDVAPGKSIGGDKFGNREGLLPKASGRQYYEADCYYTEGNRNSYRIVYSNDGLVFYTDDHYESFTQMFPSEK